MTTCRYFIICLIVLFFIPYYSNGQTNLGDNLLENASFEDWTADICNNWKSTTTASNAILCKSTDAHSGSYSVCIQSKEGSNVRLASKELVLKPGNYTFSFWVKSESGENASVRPGYGPWDEAKNAMGSYMLGEYTYDITNWQKVTYTFELKTQTQVNIVVMNPKVVNVNLLIDDASLTTSDGDIVDGNIDTDEVPTATMTIAQAQAVEAGANVSIAGTVYAACKSGAVIRDDTGYIYYYNTASDLTVGDVVKMEGAVSAYGGFNQLTNSAELKKIGYVGNISYPVAVELDGKGLDAWFVEPKIQYVQVTGELSISGNYYTLIVDGANNAVVSIIKPLDTIIENVTNNNSITVIGYAMYSSGGKYVNIVATNMFITPSDTPLVLAEVLKVEPTEITINFTPNDEVKEYYVCKFDKGGMAKAYEEFKPIFGWPYWYTYSDMIKEWGIKQTANYSYAWTKLTPNTEYDFCIAAYDNNGIAFPIQTYTFGTFVEKPYILFDKDFYSFDVGVTGKFSIYTSLDDTDLYWTSSDPSILYIDPEFGLYFCRKNGIVEILVSQKDDPSVEARATVVVGDVYCSTPTIEVINGKIFMSSETKDAQIRYTIELADSKQSGIYTESIELSPNFIIKAVASCNGCKDSEVATKTISSKELFDLRGDVNEDGNINITDVVKLVDKILEKE